MVDKVSQEKTNAEREAFVKDLYNKAVSGNPDALDKLSKIALGGYSMARDLILQMESPLVIKTKTPTVISKK